MSGHQDCVCNELGCKKEITDTDRLEWVVNNHSTPVNLVRGLFRMYDWYHEVYLLDKNKFNSFRDAIDKAMEESE